MGVLVLTGDGVLGTSGNLVEAAPVAGGDCKPDLVGSSQSGILFQFGTVLI